MTGFTKASAYLPGALRDAVNRLPESLQSRVQEIRLRLNAPLTLSAPDGDWMLTAEGRAARAEAESSWLCGQNELEECFLMLCEYSVHTHQQELRRGFVTAPNGCRAGIAGTAVTENGEIVSIRSVTSICLRVARRHDGCASRLAALLGGDGFPHSALICGEPSSGKSSLLKDLARQFSMGIGGRRFRVAVVDERGELSGDDSLNRCDVLRYCPKAEGIQQAVRCFAPEAVLFDELGTAEEVNAVLEGLNAGAASIATAHCRDKVSLMRRPQLLAAVRSGAFEKIVFLKGRRFPGEIAAIIDAEDWINECPENGGTAADRIDRGVRRPIFIDGTQPSRLFSGTYRTPD